jgi:hypothetical protein
MSQRAFDVMRGRYRRVARLVKVISLSVFVLSGRSSSGDSYAH